ncbi:MarC family protein [Thermosynechococcus sp. FA-CM-4201]
MIKGLGTTGIGVLNRILGFLILAIAVQLIADGVITFIK